MNHYYKDFGYFSEKKINPMLPRGERRKLKGRIKLRAVISLK